MKDMQIEYLPLDSLTPYEKNARKHGDFDVGIIKKSIEEFGFNDPIAVWGKKNIIVEGHGRLLAARELGMDKVPVIHLDHLTDEQRKMYALEHNRSAEMSVWDMDVLMDELKSLEDDFDLNELGFTEFLDDFTDDDPQVEEDNFEPILPDEPFSKTGDIFVLGDHRLMCGDSTSEHDLESLLGDESVDLVYTDPPYNVNVENADGMTIENDNLEEDTFREILHNAFKNASRFMKDGCAFYCWHGDSERVNFQLALEEYGLIVKQCLIWVKNSFNFGRQDYKWQHEPCLYGWKAGAGHYFAPEFNHPTVIEQGLDVDSMKKEDLVKFCKDLLALIKPSVYHENKPVKNDLHPTMKPIVLCGDMIHNSSRKKDIVLDLFGGSGSTLIACEQLGRYCRMMEIDPQYVDVIVKRFIRYVGSSRDCYLIRNGERQDLPKDWTTLLD